MAEYSLYTYNKSGGLKIYGNRSERGHYATIEEALEAFHKYVERLTKVTRYDVVKANPQVLIVEYTDKWESRIVGIISSTGVETFNTVK